MDIEKLYVYFQKEHKQQAFEEFLLKKPKDDLKHWIMDQRISLAEMEPYMKYVLDCGDTSLARGTKTSIMECVKDAYGKPYIPGSSIKGMFRTILLAADIILHKEKYNSEKRALESAVSVKKNKNIYLNKEEKKLEIKRYYTLNRKLNNRNEIADDAVNDMMSGFIVSDSEPLSMNDIILCQKIDRHVDGEEKKLNLLRECICPGTDIYFTLTIDESICKITIDDLMEAVRRFRKIIVRLFYLRFRV